MHNLSKRDQQAVIHFLGVNGCQPAEIMEERVL
jgi:hypothetical protein